MKDWERELDEFLTFNERRVLPNAGSVKNIKALEDAAKTLENREK